MKICVYSAIYEGYDALHQHVPQSVPCDFLCITDSLEPQGLTKVIKYDPLPDEPSPILKSIYLRLFPFECPLLDGYDLCIYIDGNATIVSSTFVQDLLEAHHVADYALTISKHGRTNDAYGEAIASQQMAKYALTIDLEAQIANYQSQGFPPYPATFLYWSGFLVWNRGFVTNQIEFAKLWWDEMTNYVRTKDRYYPQGQVSLSYVLWKFPIAFKAIPPLYWNGQSIRIHNHNQ